LEDIMARIRTRSWDAAEHLKTEEDMAAYLEAALQEGDSALVAAALGDIARAKGISQIARDTGLGRESLYKPANLLEIAVHIHDHLDRRTASQGRPDGQ
jgi:probable addiction module antidote protein